MPTREEMQAKLHDVADMYEKQFMREMVKQMRSTVQEGGLIKANNAEKIFREQLDDQYVEKWGHAGGVGFSQVIYDQLVEKYGAQLGLKTEALRKPVGPLKLDQKSQTRVQATSLSAPDAKSSTFTFKTTAREVQAPWAGVLLKQIELSPEENYLEIQHDNGLKSQLLFKGLAPSLGLPAKVLDGQRLGLLSPDQGQLIWTVDKNVSE